MSLLIFTQIFEKDYGLVSAYETYLVSEIGDVAVTKYHQQLNKILDINQQHCLQENCQAYAQ